MTTEKKKRGFACMDKSKVSAIASKGGKAAHAAGTAHQFTSEEARIAGRKGGIAPHVSRGSQKRKPAEPTIVKGDDGRLIDATTGQQVIVPVAPGTVERDEAGIPQRLYPESIQAKA